jgi:hypothetical protein
MIDSPAPFEWSNQSDPKPSNTTDTYWLLAGASVGTCSAATTKSGKWFVFVSRKSVDEVWAKIARATVEGRLGYLSKVSTAKPKSFGRAASSRVICVYTHDWTDEPDVFRVRQSLRELGITEIISYKSDDDTRDGVYARNRPAGLAKYRC